MFKSVFKLASLAVAMSFMSAANAADSHKPVKNELLDGGYPKAFYFRIPQRLEFHNGYDAWSEEYSRLNGMVTKAGFEELASLPHQELTDRMSRFATENPQQSVILHFNSFARDPNSFEKGTYFPGHWLYLPGTVLDQDISGKDTEIRVKGNVKKLFVVNRPFLHHKEGVSDEIVIVPLDDNGEKIWSQAEYAHITSVDVKNKSLSVERGFAGSVARSFESGKTYIAPIASMGPYGQPEEGNNKLWVYNMAENAPQDEQGRNAADVLVQELSNWFGDSGQFSDFKGVAFDLPFWDIEERKFLGRRSDANNDGKADGAVISGRNEWASGVRNFYVDLKKALGEDILITADTQYIFNQRAVDVLDGMESEGAVDHADSYKAISTTINHATYWQKYSTSKTPFSYTFYKDNGKDKRPELDKARFGFTVAQNLGLAWGINKQIMAPENGFKVGMLDEVLKGTEQKKNWLGYPVSEMRRLVLDHPDVLNGQGEALASSFIDKISSPNADISVSGDTLIVKSNSPKQKKTHLVINGLNIGKGDLTLLYETKALSKLVVGGEVVNSPYQIELRFKGNKTPKDLKPKHIMAYTGPLGFIMNEAYIREAGPAKVKIELIIRGAGEFAFKNFSLRQGAPVLAREFENGAVISNPSTEEVCLDTRQMFASKMFRRISGKQNPVLNSGKPVEDNRVCVPPVNGVVLSTVN